MAPCRCDIDPALVRGHPQPGLRPQRLGFTLEALNAAKGLRSHPENNTMSTLFFQARDAVQRFFEPRPQGTLESHERYLAASADLYDLERRMRELEQHRPHHYVLGPFGWNT